MATYIEKAKEQLSSFFAAFIEVIPGSKNSNVDVLTKLASTRDRIPGRTQHPPAIENYGANIRTIMD